MNNEMLLPSGHRTQAVPTGDLTINFQLNIDVPITGLVKGHPKLVTMLGEQICRAIEVPTYNFSYLVFNAARFIDKDSERAMRANFQTSGRTFDTEAAKLVRHGWASLADRDELINADAAQAALGIPLNVRAKYATLARDIVDMSLEVKRAALIVAGSSYSSSSPDLDVTLAGASEWDSAGGDSRVDIRALADTLAAANSLQIEHIEVFLTHKSFKAAQDDPTFIAARVNQSTETAGADELRSYWGVGRVTVGDGYNSTDGVTLTSLYGEVAILKVMQNLSEYDSREGELDSFVRFLWSRGAGIAVQPFFEKMMTSWVFPWEAWENAKTVNTKTAAIIRNTNA